MNDDKAALAKMSIAGIAATVAALTLNDWVAVLTILYLVAQLGLLVPKYWSEFTKWWRG